MIASSYRRILLVLFCLLTLATSASADCAWVLWKQSVGFAPATAPGASSTDRLYLTWQPEGAYESQIKCEQARTAKQEGKWACLPDTVDPRGPRGK